MLNSENVEKKKKQKTTVSNIPLNLMLGPH